GVEATASALVDAGWTTLRFNFGGVGRSGGSYSGGPEEVRDVAVALHAVAEAIPTGSPRLVVGYSFGAWAGAMASRDVGDLHRIVAGGPPPALLPLGFRPAPPAPPVGGVR